jgi:penicillin-binding protein 2
MMVKRISRMAVLQLVVAVCLIALMAGMFHTQVVRGLHYRKMSDDNRIRLIRLEAPRGRIYDRDGRVLASSRPSYDVYIIPEDFDPADMPELSKLLQLPPDAIRTLVAQARPASFTPVLLREDVSKEKAMEIEERRPRLSGVFIQLRARRAYPGGRAASHMVGYIGKLSPEEYRRLDRSLYHYNSWIGRAGIERIYDTRLRGEDGGRQLEVNARGEPITLLSERHPVAGEDIHLSIDLGLETSLRKSLEGKRGAILMMDLKTGGLLAAVSEPGYDPNVFVSRDGSSERLEVLSSPELPMMDRGFNGLYPAGSIFKLVTAMAALENGVITPQTTFDCNGQFKFNSRSRPFKCWFAGGHGRVDLYTGIERSCNVYFYQVGRLLGEKRLSEYAKKLGFGSKLKGPVPGAEGLVPDAAWKEKRYHEAWYPGETIMLAIGQSYLLVSPAQILRLIAAIATDGELIEPRMTTDREGRGRESQLLKADRETFRVLKQGMLRAVQSDKGTGQLARVDFMKLAAKTGTAQAPPGKAHAWFGGFFPFHDPQVALVVFVERGESGGLTGAALAKEAVELWRASDAPQMA